ncbi:Ribokinase-like protein [Serendipita vermifera]|nr:Ribokinase-like protein [Serendipita vermifera]
MSNKPILQQVKEIIPPLAGALHKGQAGRIGIFGGSRDYTGAPYFAGMAALKAGADLAHIICSPGAATAIKSYSPDLMVYPILASETSLSELTSLLDGLMPRLHVLVVGPGLGREQHMQAFARLAIQQARERGLYLVLDADAILLVQEDPDIVRGYTRAVITPNVAEFSKLCDAYGVTAKTGKKTQASINLSDALGGVTVLQKGETDIISFSHSTTAGGERETAEVVTKGGLKRCGGQGDLLTGFTATMLAWAKGYEEGVWSGRGHQNISPTRLPLLSSVGAAILTRTISRRAYEKHGRATLTSDMIPEIGPAFVDVFEAERRVSNSGL